MKSESNVRVVAPLPTACLFSCCSFCCLFLNCLSVAVNELAIKIFAFEGTHLHERFLVCCVTVSARESFHKSWLEHVNYLDNPSKISSRSLMLLNSLLAFKSKMPFTSLPFSQRFPTISPHNSQMASVDVQLRKGNPRMATISFLTTVQTHDSDDYFSC